MLWNMVAGFTNSIIDFSLLNTGTVWLGLIVIGICIFVFIVFWTYRDARQRIDCPFLAALMVFFAGPVGLLIWLVFRPRKPDANHR